MSGLALLGRAGEKGTAYTLITEKDKDFAGHLVRNLESVNQEVPSALLDLATQVMRRQLDHLLDILVRDYIGYFLFSFTEPLVP